MFVAVRWPQNVVSLSSSDLIIRLGLTGQQVGDSNRKSGPWLQRLGWDSLSIVLPLMMSSAGLSPESIYLQFLTPVSSCISATLVQTNTLYWYDYEWIQLRTVVSDHRIICLICWVSSASSTFASCAPVSVALNSRRGIDGCRLGVTRDLAMTNDTDVCPLLDSTRRLATDP